MSRSLAMHPVESCYVEWQPVLRMDGKPGRRLEALVIPFCPLYECIACGRRGGSLHVQYRSMQDRWLCMGCWNRLRPIERAQKAIDELGYLQRKLIRTRHVNQHG